MADEPVQLRASLSAYAKHRGVSRQAVSQAVKKGRLQTSIVMVDGQPTIPDFAAADAEWDLNTQTELSGAGAREMHWRAELAERKVAQADLELQKRAGQLVEGEDVTAMLAAALAALREVWEDFPDEIDQVLNVSLEESSRVEQLVAARLQRSFEKLEALVAEFS